MDDRVWQGRRWVRRWVRALLAAAVTIGGLGFMDVGGDLAAQDVTFEDYDPPSTLKVPENPITRAKFPFVDVHSHHRPGMSDAQVAEVVAHMDRMNMGVLVNLSGGSGDRLRQVVQDLEGRYPDRFVVFANISFDDIDDPDWTERTVRQFEEDVRAGARGLKIFKNLGMTVRDSRGARVRVDDPRIDPVWAKAGELGVPVLIHSADPAPFWQPHDAQNERWLELKEIPRRKRDAEVHGSFEEIIGEQHNVFRKHPGTNFINAHLGWFGNDLDRLGRLFDELPNVYTEIGAVLAELGRQPRHAHRFLVRYQDRVLFGKDSWRPDEYNPYFRTLETDDDYFEYYRRRHAFWRLYGLDLPDEVLRKLYYANAVRLIPGLELDQFER